jgi:hypothetical protein
MLLRTKAFLTSLCCLSVFSIVLVGLSRRGASAPDWIPTLKSQPTEPCPDKLDWLAALDLTYPIRYAHRDIIVKPIPGLKRASFSKVDAPLFPDFQTIDLTKDSTVELRHCESPLALEVPAYVKDSGDASHVIFGISTTLKRLDDSIPQLLRWLPNTHAKLLVIVIESEQVGEAEGVEHKDAIAADASQKEDLQSKMRTLGMDVTLVEPLGLQDMFSLKYFSLIKIMYDNRNGNTEWISLLDDDTFIPSMPAVLSMLKKYDAKKQHYIGGLSEDWWSVTHYGMMGFGGAGVFLSIALGEAMTNNYQLCTDTSWANAGDIRVLECIYQVTETKLTNERGLHQVDIHGDISGLYESGSMPLSLHHWKPLSANDEGYNLPQMHLVADICGDCFLQRWLFARDVMLTNGFSVAFYPKGNLKGLNMAEMEETWDRPSGVGGSNNGGVDHSLAPIRPKLDLTNEKIQYKLIDSAAADGVVRQSYLHKGVGEDIDSLVELFWREGKNSDEMS